jgi:preprotein translocase subunit SecA
LNVVSCSRSWAVNWREHRCEMGTCLRASPCGRSHGSPLVEYQQEDYDMFIALVDASKEETVGYLSPGHTTAAAVAIAQRPAETPDPGELQPASR